MKNIVSVREPKFKPLPGELTPAQIREAVLPVKVEALRNALMKCQELPELLHYKKEIDGLAAAVRTIKHEVPEMARQMNRLAKEAILRMGELLQNYKANPIGAGPGSGKGTGKSASERTRVQTSLGIPLAVAQTAVRMAVAPKNIVQSILDNPDIPAVMSRLNPQLPSRSKMPKSIYSDVASMLLRGGIGGGPICNTGLRGATRCLRSIPKLTWNKLTSEEKNLARKLIVECQEILDAMMQRLGD